MKQECPLPIDWLDFLETGGTGPLEEHLHSCTSCQRVVELLQGQPALSASETAVDGVTALKANGVPGSPRQGQIWIARSPFDAHGYAYSLELKPLLLITSEPTSAAGDMWFRAAPLSTDLENATDSDLVLGRDGSGIGVDTRVILQMARRLAASQLEACFGQLNRDALQRIRDARQNVLAAEYAGAPLEGGDDPRLWANEQLAETMAVLAGYSWHVREDVAQAPEVKRTSDVLISDVSAGAKVFLGVLDRFHTAHAETAFAFRLAAKSAESHDVQHFRWQESAERLLIVSAVHEMWGGDYIRLKIERVAGLSDQIVVVSQSQSGRLTTEPFVPTVGAEVEFGKGHGLESLHAQRWELWQIQSGAP